MSNVGGPPEPTPDAAARSGDANETLADQLHHLVDDPQVVGAAGLLIGGASPVAGLALGLKAAQDEQAQGRPMSTLTKFAIGRGVIGLIASAIALIIFLSVFATVMSHRAGQVPGIGNNFGFTCQDVPKPSIPGHITWTCTNGVWTGRSTQ